MVLAVQQRGIKWGTHVIEREMAWKRVRDLGMRWDVVDGFVVQLHAVGGVAEADGAQVVYPTTYVLPFFQVVADDP